MVVPSSSVNMESLKDGNTELGTRVSFSFVFFLFLPCFSHAEDIHIIKKKFFHKNRNTQIQVYTIQRLELDTDKTCEAYSIVHWEGTCRRPLVLSPSPCRVNSSYSLLILRNMYIPFQAQVICFSSCF